MPRDAANHPIEEVTMQKLPIAYTQQMKRLLGEAGFFAYMQSLDGEVTRAHAALKQHVLQRY